MYLGKTSPEKEKKQLQVEKVLIDHKTILTSKCIEALDPIYVISDILRQALQRC